MVVSVFDLGYVDEGQVVIDLVRLPVPRNDDSSAATSESDGRSQSAYRSGRSEVGKSCVWHFGS